MIFARIFRFLLMLASVLLMIAPLHSAQTAPSKTFNVTSLADTVDANPGDGNCADSNGNCTLRAAVMETNLLAGEDSIILPADIFVLSRLITGEDSANTGDLDIKGKLTLRGEGIDKTIIDGSDLKESLFEIHAGAVVSITAVTIQNSGDGDSDGGGIKNQGKLSVIDSKITDNRAENGAGIFNDSGDLTLSKSIFYNNRAEYGGAIYNDMGSTLKLFQSTIADNSGLSRAGCVFNFQAEVLISDSTLSGNNGDDKGCIANASGIIVVKNSTIHKNFASWGTGGIRQLGDAKLILINSTISDNTGCNRGGGLRIRSGTLNAFNTTISGNFANASAVNDACLDFGITSYEGGGIIIDPSGQANFYNSIISNNKAYIPGRKELLDDDCSGTVDLLSYSLLGSSDGCAFTNQNSITDQDPKIDSLENNGGPTQTHALQQGSPAVDAADPKGCKDQDGKLLTTDQRGYVRPFDGDGNGPARCDMGAYEVVKDSAFVYLPLLRK